MFYNFLSILYSGFYGSRKGNDFLLKNSWIFIARCDGEISGIIIVIIWLVVFMFHGSDQFICFFT